MKSVKEPQFYSVKEQPRGLLFWVFFILVKITMTVEGYIYCIMNPKTQRMLFTE